MQLLTLLIISKKRNNYKEKYISITRALDYFAKNKFKNELIKNEDLDVIIKDYILYRKRNKFPLDNNIKINTKYFMNQDDYKLKNKIIFSDNDLSESNDILSDIESNNSENCEHELFIKNNDDNDPSSSDSFDEKKIIKIPIFVIKI